MLALQRAATPPKITDYTSNVERITPTLKPQSTERDTDYHDSQSETGAESDMESAADDSVLYFSIKIQSITKNDACFLLFSVFPLLNYSKISER